MTMLVFFILFIPTIIIYYFVSNLFLMYYLRERIQGYDVIEYQIFGKYYIVSNCDNNRFAITIIEFINIIINLFLYLVCVITIFVSILVEILQKK